jgi:hypothetical protein
MAAPRATRPPGEPSSGTRMLRNWVTRRPPARSSTTGTPPSETTRSVTLPRTTRPSPERPCVRITTRSAGSARSWSRISSAGSPSRTRDTTRMSAFASSAQTRWRAPSTCSRDSPGSRTRNSVTAAPVARASARVKGKSRVRLGAAIQWNKNVLIHVTSPQLDLLAAARTAPFVRCTYIGCGLAAATGRVR